MRGAANLYVPQKTKSLGPAAVWLLLLIGSLVFVFAIVGAPVALARGSSVTAFVVYDVFSHLCHQQPERSFFIAGQKFAVCARCTGIYFGFALGAFAYPVMRSLRRTDAPDRKWLSLAALPLAVDFALTFFGIWENTHTSRLLTGMLLGATAVFYIIPGLVDLVTHRHRAKTQSAQPRGITMEQIATAPSDYSAPHRRI